MASADAIETTEMRFRCAAGHRWAESWPMPMTLANFGRRMQAASDCPRCGGTVYLGWVDDETTWPAPKPELSLDEQRA